jgi:hypothetical protein
LLRPRASTEKYKLSTVDYEWGAAQLTVSEPGRTAALGTGELYTAVVVNLMVEVLAETTRNAVVTVTRLR